MRDSAQGMGAWEHGVQLHLRVHGIMKVTDPSNNYLTPTRQHVA